MKITKRVASVAPSATLAITSKAKAMAKEGLDVVSFGAGEPDFDTPEPIKKVGIRALEEGFTKYTPASGIPDLKAAVSEKLKRENGLEYAPSQVVISCGAKHALYDAIQVLIEEGDEVIVVSPYWVTYPAQVLLAGGTPVIVETREEDGFRLKAEELKSAITDRTRAIFLNSPCNPSGSVLTKSDLEAVAEIACGRDLVIISDEIYEKLLYTDDPYVSIGSLGEEVLKRTVTVNGVSKTYSMTGWRIGYLAAPEEIAKAANRLQSHSTSNPTSFCQKAALEALQGDQSCVGEMLAAFRKRRAYIVERLNSMPGVSCVNPQGAFYVFPNISGLGMTSMELTNALLEKKHVAVVPGSAFGMDAHIRLSFATSMEKIEKGLDRIETFVRECG